MRPYNFFEVGFTRIYPDLVCFFERGDGLHRLVEQV